MPFTKTPAEMVNLRVKIAPEQRAALERVAAEDDRTISEVVRGAVAKVTRVPDPLPKGISPGAGRPRKKT